MDLVEIKKFLGILKLFSISKWNWKLESVKFVKNKKPPSGLLRKERELFTNTKKVNNNTVTFTWFNEFMSASS